MRSDGEKAEGQKKRRWYFYAGWVLMAVAAVFTGFLGFLTATEYRPEDVEPAERAGNENCPVFDGGDLRIVSFNTGYGGLGEESDFLMDGGKGTGAEDIDTVKKNIEGIKNILEKTDADIYMLQEVDKKSHRTFKINELDEYSSILEDYGLLFAPNYVCRFVPYPLQAPIGEIYSGVAAFSRYNVEEAQRISLPVPFSWPIRTANLKRCMLEMRIPIEDSEKQLVIFNFHLEAYDNGEGKAAQTKQLVETVYDEYEKGNYVIAGGDFNQIFPEVETDIKSTSYWVPGRLEELPDELGDWRYVYDDSVPTCRLLNQPYDAADPLTQHYVIDGFIVSPNIETKSVNTLDEGFEFSDHNPVVLEIALN